MPIPAPAIADLKKDPAALRPAELALLRNTRPFNVWGLPAISVPCGFTKSGLPIGLQIAGPHWREKLEVWPADVFASATAWNRWRALVLRASAVSTTTSVLPPRLTAAQMNIAL